MPRVIVKKTRNSGTMTESAFWSFIRSALRNKSRFWKPIQECKKKSRRPYKGENKRQKFEYQCANCKFYFPEKSVEVDHLIEAGSLRSKHDVGDFIERLFCEAEFLQTLCKPCHKNKTFKK